ncbi:MAG: SDR family oxidoreductase [Bacteroidota bacterium]
MGKYTDKVVWITGASSGIGEALSYAFAKEGARLVLSARREAELRRVQQQSGLPEERVLVLPLDLAQLETMAAKVAAVVERFGRIDVLVNNGGLSQRSLIIDTDISVYKRLMEVNYLGTVALTKAVLPVFIQQQSGQIGVISSLMGKFASPLRSGYCGAKHALHGFFDALRFEHEKNNVEVTLLCPGFIRTNVSRNALTADGSPQQKMDAATDKGMSPEHCAEQIIAALRRGKFEAYIGGKETLAIYVKRLFPKLLHRIVRNAQVQ